jgi:hypothetical protein
VSSLEALSSPDVDVRMSALVGLDQVDLALAAIIIVETARERSRHIKLRETAYELAHVVLAGKSLQLTHHVLDLARQHGLAGHLTVQYAELLNGPGSFTDSLKTCREDQFMALVTEYAHNKALVDRDWLMGSWAEQSMVVLIPFVTSELALKSLTRCQSYAVADAALERCAEVLDQGTLLEVLETCTVRDSAWANTVTKASLAARLDLAVRPNFSFIKRRAAQRTLSTETLLELLETAEPHVKNGIEEELALRV